MNPNFLRKEIKVSWFIRLTFLYTCPTFFFFFGNGKRGHCRHITSQVGQEIIHLMKQAHSGDQLIPFQASTITYKSHCKKQQQKTKLSLTH